MAKPAGWRPEWLLAGGSLLACASFLALAELGLRLADPDYLDERPAVAIDRLHRYSERYGWELKPGAHQLDDGKPVSVNALGYRGQPLPQRPASGQQRVVMLGDSVTFGTYVSDGQTFADVLQARDNGLEIVNLAVQGYGLGQELLRLEREGLAYEPAVVVANICLANDFADIMLPVFLYDGRHPKPYFSLRGGQLELRDAHLQLGWRARLGLWLAERSVLYRHLARRPVEEPRAAEEHWTERRRKAVLDGAAAEELMAALIVRLRREVERDQARLVLVAHPSKASYRGNGDWLERVARQPGLTGLQVVSLKDAYRAAGLPYDALALDGIGHLSPQGHRLAADALLTALGSWPGAS